MRVPCEQTQPGSFSREKKEPGNEVDIQPKSFSCWSGFEEDPEKRHGKIYMKRRILNIIKILNINFMYEKENIFKYEK